MNIFIIIFFTLMTPMLVAMELVRPQQEMLHNNHMRVFQLSEDRYVIIHTISYADFKNFEKQVLISAQALLNGEEEFCELRSQIKGLGTVGEQEERLNRFAYSLINCSEEEMVRLFYNIGIDREALKQELYVIIARTTRIVVYLGLAALSKKLAYLKDHPLIEYKLGYFFHQAARFYRGIYDEVVRENNLEDPVYHLSVS